MSCFRSSFSLKRWRRHDFLIHLNAACCQYLRPKLTSGYHCFLLHPSLYLRRRSRIPIRPSLAERADVVSIDSSLWKASWQRPETRPSSDCCCGTKSSLAHHPPKCSWGGKLRAWLFTSLTDLRCSSVRKRVCLYSTTKDTKERRKRRTGSG